VPAEDLDLAIWELTELHQSPLLQLSHTVSPLGIFFWQM
jgi:hypothetical protein